MSWTYDATFYYEECDAATADRTYSADNLPAYVTLGEVIQINGTDLLFEPADTVAASSFDRTISSDLSDNTEWIMIRIVDVGNTFDYTYNGTAGSIPVYCPSNRPIRYLDKCVSTCPGELSPSRIVPDNGVPVDPASCSHNCPAGFKMDGTSCVVDAPTTCGTNGGSVQTYTTCTLEPYDNCPDQSYMWFRAAVELQSFITASRSDNHTKSAKIDTMGCRGMDGVVGRLPVAANNAA